MKRPIEIEHEECAFKQHGDDELELVPGFDAEPAIGGPFMAAVIIGLMMLFFGIPSLEGIGGKIFWGVVGLVGLLLGVLGPTGALLECMSRTVLRGDGGGGLKLKHGVGSGADTYHYAKGAFAQMVIVRDTDWRWTVHLMPWYADQRPVVLKLRWRRGGRERERLEPLIDYLRRTVGIEPEAEIWE